MFASKFTSGNYTIGLLISLSSDGLRKTGVARILAAAVDSILAWNMTTLTPLN